MPVLYYPAIVERGRDGFGVFFPDLPGCVSAGATVQEAALAAEEALQGHVEVTLDHGGALPAASELDAVAAEPGVDEAARVLVRVEVPSRAARVNITLPEELLAAIDRYAKRSGFTRSGMLAQAAREMMRGRAG